MTKITTAALLFRLELGGVIQQLMQEMVLTDCMFQLTQSIDELDSVYLYSESSDF